MSEEERGGEQREERTESGETKGFFFKMKISK